MDGLSTLMEKRIPPGSGLDRAANTIGLFVQARQRAELHAGAATADKAKRLAALCAPLANGCIAIGDGRLICEELVPVPRGLGLLLFVHGGFSLALVSANGPT